MEQHVNETLKLAGRVREKCIAHLDAVGTWRIPVAFDLAMLAQHTSQYSRLLVRDG
jgi:hypothetical protein